MAAKKAQKPKRDDVAVKIDRAVISDAKMVVARTGQTLAEYLSDHLRGPVKKDLDRILKNMGNRD